MKSEDAMQDWKSYSGRRGRTVRVVLVVSVLVVAGACVAIFLMRREPPQKAAADVPVRESPVSRPEAPEALAVIRSRGVVTPKVQVQIMPEVAGRVVYVHSQLHAGGLIRANERIAQIDPSGYDLAVRRARAAVDETQAKLDVELAAKGMRPEQNRPFDPEGQVALPAVLQEPLVRQAAAAVESAKAELANAELQLSRTSVSLPHDVFIAGETVNLGQYVDVGRSLAVAYGTEVFEIEAPIRSEDLGRLGGLEALGFVGDASEGSRPAVEVRSVFAGGEHIWRGEVLRTTGRVDPNSGMVSIVVEVPQPLDVGATHASPVQRPPLLPGMAVEVLIGGGREAGTVQGSENVGDL